MKKEIKKVIKTDIAILLFVLLFGLIIFGANISDLMAFLGAGLLLVAIINSILGIGSLLVSLANRNPETRRYAASMLLVAGISFLCGFTFCSTTHIRL